MALGRKETKYLLYFIILRLYYFLTHTVTSETLAIAGGSVDGATGNVYGFKRCQFRYAIKS